MDAPSLERLEQVGARQDEIRAAPQPRAVRKCRALMGPAGLARLPCGTQVIQLSGRIFRKDSRRFSPQGHRALEDLARLLAEHPQILVLRIEVSVASRTAVPAEKRKLMQRAQDHADVIFGYLWRYGHVDPERLEAVGYGESGRALRRFDDAFSEPEASSLDRPFRVALRVVHWARDAHQVRRLSRMAY